MLAFGSSSFPAVGCVAGLFCDTRREDFVPVSSTFRPEEPDVRVSCGEPVCGLVAGVIGVEGTDDALRRPGLEPCRQPAGGSAGREEDGVSSGIGMQQAAPAQCCEQVWCQGPVPGEPVVDGRPCVIAGLKVRLKRGARIIPS